MYVDESGDVGLTNSPTRYFALSGLVVHELRWQEYLDQLIEFRKRLKPKFGLKLREEIHSGTMFTRPNELARIPKYDRLAIVRMFADELATMKDISLINVICDKTNKSLGYDVFEKSWSALLTRFENTMQHHNFPGPKNPDDKGIIIPDNTDNKKLVRLLRKLRYYNPVPNQAQYGIGYRNIQLKYIIEDANFRDSRDSYFIQGCDLVAFLLYQINTPSAYFRKKYAHKYFERLDPVLCKVASNNDPHGIVRL